MKSPIIRVVIITLIPGILAAGCGKIAVKTTTTMTTSTTSSTLTTSSTTTDIGKPNSASTETENGLSLSLSTDRTTYQPGQEIAITVDEKNILSTTNNIPAADNLPSEFMSGFPNDPSFPLGLAILRGNYTVLNYSNVIPLIIFNPSEVYTGIIITAPVSYSFDPGTDVPVLNGGDYNSSNAIWLHIEISVNGYWPNNESSSSKNLDPGVYTVLGGDEWGALVVLHFTVTDAAGTNSVSSSSVNGLRLSLSLDFKTYFPGQDISIIIDETNTLTAVNNIPVSDSWPYGHLQKAPCDYTSPFGITAFQGDYSSSNFSTGTPLTLYDPHAAWLCTTINPITSYSFQPSTDWAKVNENPTNPITGPQQMKYQLTIHGYWPDNDSTLILN